MAFIEKLRGERIELDFADIEPLRKEILYYFDQNMGDIINAYVPNSDYKHKYWEYLNFHGEKHSYEEEENFFIDGCLLIINAMICEYLDIIGGNQKVFGNTKLEEVYKYILNFEPKDNYQDKIKSTTLKGLEIAESITDKIINTNSEFKHPNLFSYYEEVKWIDEKIIGDYLKDRIKTVYNNV